MCVFLAGRVGDQFAETVDAALATIDRKLFRNAVDGMEARGTLLGGNAIPDIGIVFEARGRFAARERIQAIGAINAIGTPEDQGKAARAGVFQDVDGTEPIIADVEK